MIVHRDNNEHRIVSATTLPIQNEQADSQSKEM